MPDSVRGGVEHLRHHPAELLAAEGVDVVRLVGRHQVPVTVGLPAAGRVEVRQAERVAVLVRDDRRMVDGRLGVEVVGADADVDLERVARVGGRHRRVAVVGVPERLVLEVLELVVGREAGQAGDRVGVVELQARRVRPDVVVGTVGLAGVRVGQVAARDAELGRAVAAAAGEDGHEEVHDAVLVGVVVGVVDLGVGDRGRVHDELAGRATARVDLLQRTDAGERADDGGPVGVGPVVAGGAGQLVDAVLDALGVERVRRQRVVAVRHPGAGLAGHQLGEGERLVTAGGGVAGVGEVSGRDARRGHGAVGVELTDAHLLEEVERRPLECRGVDDGVEGALVGAVVAVGVGDGHDGERPVAVPRGVVLRARGDDLGAVAGERLGGTADRDRRRGRQVAPHDRRKLGGRRGAALEHERLAGVGGQRADVPGVGPGFHGRRSGLHDGAAHRSGDGDRRAQDRERGGVAHDDA